METTLQPAPPRARRLVRRKHDRVIGGVAGGLADYFGIDPVIFRIGFLVTALAGGTGVLAYLAGWLLIPEADEATEGPPRRSADRPQTWIGVCLLVLGAAMLLGQFGWWSPEVLWAFALIGLGVILFRQDREQRWGPAAQSPPPPPSGGDGGPSSAATAPHGPESSALPYSGAEARAATGSSLGLLTTAAALLAAGVAALLSNFGVLQLEWYEVLALALAVVGGGLIVGAWWGRARGLIAIGLLLVPFVFAAGVIRAPLRGGFGELHYAPRSASELHSAYRLGAGRMVLDLTRYPFGEEPVDVDVDIAMGELLVRVPPEVPVEARGRASLGEVNILGEVEGGSDVEVTHVSPGGGRGVLRLDLSTALGEVRVEHATTPLEPSPTGWHGHFGSNDEGWWR